MGIKIELICPGVWSPRHGFHHGALTPTNVLQIFSFCALAVGQVRFTVVCQRAHTSIHTISELSNPVHVLAVVMQLLFLCCVFLSVSSKFEIRVLKTASAHKRHFIHVNICLC